MTLALQNNRRGQEIDNIKIPHMDEVHGYKARLLWSQTKLMFFLCATRQLRKYLNKLKTRYQICGSDFQASFKFRNEILAHVDTHRTSSYSYNRYQHPEHIHYFTNHHHHLTTVSSRYDWNKSCFQFLIPSYQANQKVLYSSDRIKESRKQVTP